MAPADSTRVVICVIALASVGLAFFLLRKYRRPKKSSKSSAATASDGHQEETPVTSTLGGRSQQSRDGFGDCGCKGGEGTSPGAGSLAENKTIVEGEAIADESAQDQSFASVGAAEIETEEESLATGNLGLATTGIGATDVELKGEPVESTSSVSSWGAGDTEIKDQLLTSQTSSRVSSAVSEIKTKEEQSFGSGCNFSEDEANIKVSNNQLAQQVAAVVEQTRGADVLTAKSVGEQDLSTREVTNSLTQNVVVDQTAESSGNEDVAKDQYASAEVERGVADEDAVKSSHKQPAAPIVGDEDTESVQSGDVSNGDAQSFEQISSNNEREGGQDEAEDSKGPLKGVIPDFFVESLQGPDSSLPSFENVGADDEGVSVSSFGPVENSNDAADIILHNENNDAEGMVTGIQELEQQIIGSGDNLPSSFEPISIKTGEDTSLSFEPVSSSIEVIQSSDFTESKVQDGFASMQDVYSNTSAKVHQTPLSGEHATTATAVQNKSVSESASSLGSIEVIQLPASDTQDSPGTAASTFNNEASESLSHESSTGADKSLSSIEVIQGPPFDANAVDDSTDRSPPEVAALGTSGGQEKAVQDMNNLNNSMANVGVVRQAALDTGSVNDLRSAFADARSKMSSPSSESFQSLELFEGSTTSGSKQDFFSLSNSPEPGEETFEGAASDSLLQREARKGLSPQETMSSSTSYDTDLDFTTATESPPDHTPTNTPTLEITEEFLVGGREQFLDSLSAGVGQQEPESTVDTPTEPGMLEADLSYQWMLGIDKDKITETVTQAQTHPDKMTIGQLQVLVEMLKQDDMMMLDTALRCIIRVSAFTTNVEVLQVCQCPVQLTRLLQKFAPVVIRSTGEGVKSEQEELLLNITRAINNLAMDMKSQAQLEVSIPVLTELLLTDGISEDVTIGALLPLTNLSGSPAYHKHYTSVVQQLYGFLDTSHNTALRLQCLKVLVNLSLNGDIVPHLLAAKAPECLLELLDINSSFDLLLRMVTFLANILSIMHEKQLTASSLPPDHKAPSPETLYAALFALDNRDTLRNKAFLLSRHQSEDVAYHASRLYEFITKLK